MFNKNLLFISKKICINSRVSRIILILLVLYQIIGCKGSDEPEITNTKQEVIQEEGVTIDEQGRLIITQYKIEWTFDKTYEYGNFVNGDFYVIGQATIVSVTPGPSDDRNGSMINPITDSGQAYDDRIADYDSNLSIKFPYILSPGESLVSSISLTPSDFKNNYVKDFSGRNVSQGHVHLKTVSVLTCLASKPQEGTFRPPFVGTEKTLYNINQIQYNLLPSLELVSHMPNTQIFNSYIEYFKRGFERPWLVHLSGWTNRLMHPIENMLNYHREIANFWGEASLLLLLDIPINDKKELLIKYIQTGLDLYHMSILGAGDSAFNKWPILFTGIMLNELKIYNVFNEGRSKTSPREDRMTYYITDETSPFSSSIIPDGELWTEYKTIDGKAPAWAQDRGNHEHEHLHPSEWGNDAPVPDGGGLKREAYRQINSRTYVASMLAALIMGKKAIWNHPSFFDYVDRWMNEDMTPWCSLISDYWTGESYGDPDPSSYQTSGFNFIDDIWTKYRNLY